MQYRGGGGVLDMGYHWADSGSLRRACSAGSMTLLLVFGAIGTPAREGTQCRRTGVAWATGGG